MADTVTPGAVKATLEEVTTNLGKAKEFLGTMQSTLDQIPEAIKGITEATNTLSKQIPLLRSTTGAAPAAPVVAASGPVAIEEEGDPPHQSIITSAIEQYKIAYKAQKDFQKINKTSPIPENLTKAVNDQLAILAGLKEAKADIDIDAIKNDIDKEYPEEEEEPTAPRGSPDPATVAVGAGVDTAAKKEAYKKAYKALKENKVDANNVTLTQTLNAAYDTAKGAGVSDDEIDGMKAEVVDEIAPAVGVEGGRRGRSRKLRRSQRSQRYQGYRRSQRSRRPIRARRSRRGH